jgi:ribosome-binding factor A
MPSRRLVRLNELLREELSDLIQHARDPRLQGLVSVTEVDISPDLHNAQVHVSVLGTAEERKTLLRGLQAATPYFRHELGERLKDLRRIPDLTFHQDDSIERGARIMALLNGDAAPNPDIPLD